MVFRHVFNQMTVPPGVRHALAQSPVALLLNAQGAVQLFFVLSGWVLAASLARSGERAPWLQFYVKRVFRIHPPYVAAVLVALATTLVPPAPRPFDVPLAQQAMAAAPDAASLAAHLAFPGTAGGLLPVGWTLRIEMIFSFLLPLLALAASGGRALALLAASAALAFAADADVARYGFDFALGAVLQRERRRVGAWLRALPAAGRALVVVAGLVLVCAPLLFWPRLVRGILIAGWLPHEILVMGLGCGLLVAAAVDVPAFGRALSRPACLFLGRISYPLYLLHSTFLVLLAPRFLDGTQRGSFGLLLAVTLVSIVASVPFHAWIERPSIALGNRVCRALARRTGTRAIESEAALP